MRDVEGGGSGRMVGGGCVRARETGGGREVSLCRLELKQGRSRRGHHSPNTFPPRHTTPHTHTHTSSSLHPAFSSLHPAPSIQEMKMICVRGARGCATRRRSTRTVGPDLSSDARRNGRGGLERPGKKDRTIFGCWFFRPMHFDDL